MLWRKLSAIVCLFVLTLHVASYSQARGANNALSANDPCPELSQIKEQHPRLLLNSEIISSIHHSIDSYELARQEFQLLEKRGAEILVEPPVHYVDGDLLEVSRTALKRIYTLGLLYQLTHQTKFSERAKTEMLAIAKFPDWHPEHFLDTAEMTHAMGIGYDWVFDQLEDHEKKIVETSILNFGLKPGIDAVSNHKYFWVDEHRSNWNIVCYGGLLIGSLAIARSDDQNIVKSVNLLLPICTGQLRQSFRSFNPDGAWCEGPNYWNYSTIYAATSIEALQTSCGSEYGLSACEGLTNAGNFFVDLIGPTNKLFNFADASEVVRNTPQLFWFSRKYAKPALAVQERQLLRQCNDKLDCRDLIWFNAGGTSNDLLSRPLINKYLGDTQLATMRSSRGVDAFFVALKGGDNATHHSHLELGTFVLDAEQYRWVTELGMENYDLPGFFDTTSGDKSARWKYYRTRTEGQNAVVINSVNQDVGARGLLTDCTSAPPNTLNSVALNLDQAYASRGITKFTRNFYLLKNPRALLIVDDIIGSEHFDATWQIHTYAKVEPQGSQLVLRQGSGELLLQRLLPRCGSLEVSDVNLRSPQVDTSGVSKISVKSPNSPGHTCFAVLFVPLTSEKGSNLAGIMKWLEQR